MDRSCIKYDSDDIHAERKEQSFESELEEYKSLRDKAYRKEKIMPCKSFNDNGFCNNASGHLNQFGKRTLHICKVCYYKRGQKCDHSQANCNVVDEPCVDFNNGDCMFQSGHLSYDGKYSRHHICRICIVKYEVKKYHPAIECKHNENLIKCPNNALKRERFESKIHERHDSQPNEKPCGFFNTKGRCRYPNGHGSRGFMKQVHVCSCCLEFLSEARTHPAINCDLRKRILGGRRKNFNNQETKELACDAFNFSHCSLESGHSLFSGDRRAFHICKICFEYRGEKNFHPKNECMLKKKFLLELENESRTKYRYSCTKKDMPHAKPSENEKIKIKTPKDINILVSFTKKGGTETVKNKQNENASGNDKLKAKASKELTDIQILGHFTKQGGVYFEKNKRSAKVSEVSQAIVKATPEVSQAIVKATPEASQAVPKTIHKVSQPVAKALHKVSRPIGKAVPEVNQPVEKVMTKTIPPVAKATNEVSQPVFKVCLIKRKAPNVQDTGATISPCKHFKRADGTMNTSGSKLNEAIKPDKTILEKKCSNPGGLQK